MNGRDADHGLTRFRRVFIVLAQMRITTKPGTGAFDNPTLGQNFKAYDIIGTQDNIQDDIEMVFDPLNQFAARAAIGPDTFQTLSDRLRNVIEQEFGTSAVLDIGWMNDHM